MEMFGLLFNDCTRACLFVWFVCNNTCYIALHSTTMSQALRVLVPVANGSEEIETVTIVGMLLHDTHTLSLSLSWCV
jgi:sensor histidine kinase regulating citrate/malate metabolism